MFAQKRIRPNSWAYEAQGGYPPELLSEPADLGLLERRALNRTHSRQP